MPFAHALAHLVYPRYSNNHKAKLLHSSSLFLLSFILVLYQLVLTFLPATGIRVLGYASNISVDEVIRLTNQKRAEAGLPALQYNASLTQAAKAKAEHMIANDYWAHVAPDGTEPWKFFTDVGYKYRYAGENLARDFSSPQAAVDAWMASPSHRENLMSPKYKEIGIGVTEGDLGGVEATIVVQLFGTQLVDTTPQTPIAQAQAQTVASPTSRPLTPTLRPLTPTTRPLPTATLTQAPTATLTPTPTSPPAQLIASDKPVSGSAPPIQTLISPFNTTKTVSLVTIVALLAVMVIDGLVAHKKRLSRIGGKTFAHIAFLGMIAALVLIIRAGQVL